MLGNNRGYIQLARYIVSLSWIYHGFFPKLYHIAPLEKLMTGSAGFSAEVSDLITRSAGFGEIIFGLCLFVFYNNKHLVILNILALIGLLLAVVVMQPQLLIEAFNPVTTNLPLIGLSVIWLKEIKLLNNRYL
ncbi:DoxX-like family protein [Pseudoalteromonas sp. APC 3358]|uniref:DoxX-like family protein n=1 Tax=Pseudoalteromonas sp. APC 3358 TaxID=3035176 RepID=UPI0025B570C1|nr:DoxX-like family protein [Pseudoalteromonas sp. APC 3358]MDN3382066.1 DoxX-like family protein [Pseudoalteromonas sp. APC 3358]